MSEWSEFEQHLENLSKRDLINLFSKDKKIRAELYQKTKEDIINLILLSKGESK